MNSLEHARDLLKGALESNERAMDRLIHGPDIKVGPETNALVLDMAIRSARSYAQEAVVHLNAALETLNKEDS